MDRKPVIYKVIKFELLTTETREPFQLTQVMKMIERTTFAGKCILNSRPATQEEIKMFKGGHNE